MNSLKNYLVTTKHILHVFLASLMKSVVAVARPSSWQNGANLRATSLHKSPGLLAKYPTFERPTAAALYEDSTFYWASKITVTSKKYVFSSFRALSHIGKYRFLLLFSNRAFFPPLSYNYNRSSYYNWIIIIDILSPWRSELFPLYRPDKFRDPSVHPRVYVQIYHIYR